MEGQAYLELLLQIIQCPVGKVVIHRLSYHFRVPVNSARVPQVKREKRAKMTTTTPTHRTRSSSLKQRACCRLPNIGAAQLCRRTLWPSAVCWWCVHGRAQGFVPRTRSPIEAHELVVKLKWPSSESWYGTTGKGEAL